MAKFLSMHFAITPPKIPNLSLCSLGCCLHTAIFRSYRPHIFLRTWQWQLVHTPPSWTKWQNRDFRRRYSKVHWQKFCHFITKNENDYDTAPVVSSFKYGLLCSIPSLNTQSSIYGFWLFGQPGQNKKKSWEPIMSNFWERFFSCLQGHFFSFLICFVIKVF